MRPIDIALIEYGVREFKGTGKHNKSILEYFSMSGHSWVKDDETPWCAAFMNHGLEKAGIKGSGKLNARSFLKVGKKTTKPQLGDIVVFWREKPESWKGHVGFYITERDGFVYCLGGNQQDQVKISAYKLDRVLDYRRVEKGEVTPLVAKDLGPVELAEELLSQVKDLCSN